MVAHSSQIVGAHSVQIVGAHTLMYTYVLLCVFPRMVVLAHTILGVMMIIGGQDEHQSLHVQQQQMSMSWAVAHTP